MVLTHHDGNILPADISGLLPVLIEPRDYAQPGWRDRSFLDSLDRRHHTGDRLGLPQYLLERRLSEPGRVLVIFAGLDELFDPGTARRFDHYVHFVTFRQAGWRRSALSCLDL